jgi:hypothetical protein
MPNVQAGQHRSSRPALRREGAPFQSPPAIRDRGGYLGILLGQTRRFRLAASPSSAPLPKYPPGRGEAGADGMARPDIYPPASPLDEQLPALPRRA